MATAQMSRFLRRLTRGMAAETLGELTDRQLLERLLAAHDEPVFEAVVRRHGPMVYRVCWRVLQQAEDTEDAFQATFLLLARKLQTVRKRDSLASWLHGVAHRIALDAKSRVARRRGHEARAAANSHPGPPDEITWRELRTAFDAELGQLPEKWRLPLILCYLEGRSQEEAARQLGWSKSTLLRRLEEARAALGRRLTRRGVVWPAALSAVLLSDCVAPAALAPGLVGSTVEAAACIATGQATRTAAVSAKVAALTEGALRTMLVSKLKFATAALVLAAVAGGFVVAVAAAWVGPPVGPASALAVPRAEDADADSDGDGLSDFHEVHKYRTDPNKKDTAGKGVSDGVGQQRREFTYSVRAVIRVMPPYNLKALNDEYQDVRVRKETKEYAELEVVAYPFNSNAEAIKGNPNWKKDYAGMKEYLAPGITTNWDEEMRKDLLRDLAKEGIDPDKLTDKQVVEQVSRWLFKRSKFRDMFCTFYVGFRDGKPEVLPGLEKAFQRDRGDPKWTVQEQLEHELFGKEMFARRTYGTCTSTAVYQTTVLRALGIPTRMILCIPLADGSDPAQIDMVDKGLTNHRVRYAACLGALSGGTGFASHTFCEVFVGGRWRRLNSTTLGQNILERNYLGLMIHVHTFKDLSEANLAATWGTRYAKGQRDAVFPHSNPYRLLEVGDHFGKYAEVPNPPADKEHKQVTITKAYWPDKDAPAEIREMEQRRVREVLPLLEMGALGQDRRFYIHCQEWLEDAGDYLQYKLFMRRADTNFVLRAKGQKDVSCQISMNFYTHRSRNLCELEVVIPSSESAKMTSGVAYTLHPVNGKKGYEWSVRDSVRLTRP